MYFVRYSFWFTCVFRLIFDDLHKQRDEPAVEFDIVLPDYTQYKDVNADQTLTKVIAERLKEFLAACRVLQLYSVRPVQGKVCNILSSR